jgi:hypothetical protein
VQSSDNLIRLQKERARQRVELYDELTAGVQQARCIEGTLCIAPGCGKLFESSKTPRRLQCSVMGCRLFTRECGCRVRMCSTCHEPLCPQHFPVALGQFGPHAWCFASNRCGFCPQDRCLSPECCGRYMGARTLNEGTGICHGCQSRACNRCLWRCYSTTSPDRQRRSRGGRGHDECDVVWCNRCGDPSLFSPVEREYNKLYCCGNEGREKVCDPVRDAARAAATQRELGILQFIIDGD